MLVLACGVYFALQGSVSSSNIVATVSDSSGSGVQADGIAGLRSLQAGDALAAGEIVRAEAGGRVRFQYRDGTWVELSAPQTGMSALLALTQATEKTAKQLRLDAGSLTADVRPQPNGQPFTVITPQARAVVRGTVLTLAVNADETRLDVRRGKVEIERLADRAKVSVAEGFYAVVGRQTALALEARSQSVAAVVAETKTPPAEPPVTPPPLPPNIDVRPPVATNTIARDTDTLRDGVASDFLTRVHTSAGGQRVPYRLFMPLRYDKTQKYPLVVFLHGIGEKGTDNVRTISNNANGAFVFIAAKNQADHPCFMLVPQSNSGWWGECAATLSQLLGALQQEYSIDADRCYVTGLSSGGSGAWDMILMYPKLFAAAVPICGNNNPAKASAAVGVAVWSFHTADDPTMKVEGSRTMIAALRKAGGKPFYTEYPTGGHSSAWVRAYQEPALVDWLFTQKRGRDATPPATLPFPH
jgi:poly(3-hydroxybutyrate) depolymerase